MFNDQTIATGVCQCLMKAYESGAGLPFSTVRGIIKSHKSKT
ncbi:MAG: hypothetical protein ACJAWL_000965 [Motiliproteus sp.]|jgi:hypothetical protein